MFLSIIIPVYKVEAYLCECLDSIAASRLDCWEAIIIDDGSPDGCPQICDEYTAKDSRFRVIHQENVGVAAARNAGIDIAKGEWIWFVDSDDIVDMRPVGDMVEWLEKHMDVDLVMFDLETFKENETPVLRNSDLSYTDVDDSVERDVDVKKNNFLMKNICYNHQRLWYRRGWLNHYQRPIRFSLRIRVAEDLEFQYKYLTLCQHPVKVDAVLYHYRLRETSVTGDAAYRQRAVEDLPVVLGNLAEWNQDNHVKPESWLDYRIMKLLQNLLYSASCINNLEIKEFQNEVDIIIEEYTKQHFPFVKDIRIWLAKNNVKAYFLFNRLYLKIKGI